MGSTGSGSFSDYPGSGSKTGKNKSSNQNGGGSSGDDRCERAFSTQLEDVGNSDLYLKNNSVPNPGDQLTISFSGQRLFAVDNQGLKVGALPTKYNYLRACLEAGYGYVGIVSHSATSPVPAVSADFTVDK